MHLQDPQLRPSVTELLQHEFLRGAVQQEPEARRSLASLARRRQALNLQINVCVQTRRLAAQLLLPCISDTC